MDLEDIFEMDVALLIGIGLWFVVGMVMMKTMQSSLIWKILFGVILLPICVISAKFHAKRW